MSMVPRDSNLNCVMITCGTLYVSFYAVINALWRTFERNLCLSFEKYDKRRRGKNSIKLNTAFVYHAYGRTKILELS